MAKILLIDGESIKPLDKIKFTEEGELQDYLEKYPFLIPLSEIVEEASDLLCIGREVIAGPGAVDLLFIDKDGLLTIVETKLAKNSEARRTVIGQIIEYASYISQWTADKVYEIANAYLKSNLDEVIREISKEELSIEDFRSNIGQNLKNGKIRLIIAVDELIEPLRATVTFLNSYSNFDILLLQVSSFEESKTRKVLIPSLFGYAKPTSPVRKRWDEKRFFDVIKESLDISMVNAITKLYDFTKSNADEISWGTGAYEGSFTFRRARYGKKVSILSVFSSGYIQFNFGNMKDNGLKEEILEPFREKLNEIPDVKLPKEVVSERGKYPYMKADFITNAKNLGHLQDTVLSLCQQMASSSDE